MSEHDEIPGPVARPAVPTVPTRRAFMATCGVGAMTMLGRPLAAGAQVMVEEAMRWRRQRRPMPTPAQLAWQRDEFALFIHFGINTFTDREWGDGRESPTLFDPSALDARQWARVAREAGARAMVLTAKHHDGFCLWPTATTTHSVASSPWRGGRGDLVREFVTACRAEGLKVGLYCSPWDRNHPAYGDSPRYNAAYQTQLTELLTQYGPIHEVWFDGANGEGPNGKRQEYDWPATWSLVRRLQPEAVIFSDVGPDVRWVGNERGVAGEVHWSTIRPDAVRYPGDPSPTVSAILQEGHADGSVWRPSETDVSIRPGWFHHTAEDARVKSAETLEELWFTSVGRNSKLLLNVPPTRDGLFHERDVAALRGMRARLDAWRNGRVTGGRQTQRSTGTTSAEVTVRWRRPQAISVVSLREPIERGQMVGAWTLFTGDVVTPVARGTTIGHQRLIRLPEVTTESLRLVIETVGGPVPLLAIECYQTITK